MRFVPPWAWEAFQVNLQPRLSVYLVMPGNVCQTGDKLNALKDPRVSKKIMWRQMGKKRGNTLILVREMKVVDSDFCSQFILSDLK